MARNSKPLQRVSQTEKEKDDFLWAKQTAIYYLGSSSMFNNALGGNSSISRKEENYNILNNKIPEKWFHHITNPLGTDKENYKNFPAKIRPYNIIIPNSDLYLGEFIKRNFKYQVLNKSEEGYNSFIEEKTNALRQNIRQHYINSLVEAGQVDEENYEEVELPQELNEEFLSNFQDHLALKGQSVLAYIDSDKRTFEVFKECFYDWIAVGECHTYKNIVRGDIEYERVNPLTFTTDFGEDTKYGEDGNFAVRRRRVSVSDLVSSFYDELSPEQIMDFEKALPTFSGSVTGTDENFSDKAYLYHVTWKSQKIIKILSYIDDFGQYQEMEVDELYKADKTLGESTKEITINEWWETHYIPSLSTSASTDFNTKSGHFFRIRPIPVQRGLLNNSAACKGLYNSIYFKNENADNISVVDLGKPYLILFIILNYKIELTIAKSKGKIVLIDQNVIPNEEGWDEEKFMYYGEALGWGIINRNQIGVDKSYNQYQVLDLGLYQDISQLINIKENIKNDYDELLGISRQRKGQVSASETATATNTASVNSSVISEYIFDKFDDFRRVEYEGLLDLSQFAYSEGKKGLYIGSDGRTRLLELLEGDLQSAELGICVSRSSNDSEKLNMFKSYAQAFAQNGAAASTVGKIIQADSLLEVTKVLEGIEEKQAKAAESNAQSEQEAQLALKEVEKEFEAYRHMLGLETMNVDHDRLDNREYIKGDIELTKESMSESTPDSVPDISNIEDRNSERVKELQDQRKQNSEEAFKSKEMSLKERELDIKEKDTDNKLKIAKVNKNKHDKK